MKYEVSSSLAMYVEGKVTWVQAQNVAIEGNLGVFIPES